MKFYRYESGMSDEGVYIWLNTYQLKRETQCYYIVNCHQYCGKEIRVPKNPDNCKRIHHSLESAWKSFMIRQQRRIDYAERNIEIAKTCIKYNSGNPPSEEKCLYIDNSKINKLYQI